MTPYMVSFLFEVMSIMKVYETKLVLFSKKTRKGYPVKLRIRNFLNQKYEFIGTGFYLEKDDWDSYTNSPKRSHIRYGVIMDKKTELEDLISEKFSNDTGILSVKAVKDESKRYNFYFEKYLKYLIEEKRYSSHDVAVAMNKHFTHCCEFESIKLSKLTKNFLRKFWSHLTKKETGLSDISANLYMKRFVSFLNYLAEEHEIYIKHDFLKKRYKRIPKKEPKVINDLNGLMSILFDLETCNILTNKKLRALYKIFISICLNGIRSIDLHSLKWSNFYIQKEVVEDVDEKGNICEYIDTEVYVSYRMLKTGEFIEFSLPIEIFRYLTIYTTNERTQEIIDEYDNFLLMKLTTNKYKDTNYNHQKFSRDFSDLKESYNKKNNHLNKLSEIDEDFYIERLALHKQAVISQIEGVRKGAIKDSYLTGDVNENLIAKKKEEEERKRYLKTKTNNYNRLLKEATIPFNIKNISSHSARFTFSELAIENGVDIFDVSQLLGHSNTVITENYLKRFKKKKLSKAAKPAFKGL